MSRRIQVRRANSSEWTSVNPILSVGEFGFEINTNLLKVGNGSAAWVSLPYLNIASTISIADSANKFTATDVEAALLELFNLAVADSITFAASDESTPITSGNVKATFRMPRGMTLTEARASLTTASAAGMISIDIKKNGTSIFSTPLTIDQGEKTSVTAATPSVISTATLADDDEITVDFVSAGVEATGVKITLIGVRL